MSDTSTAPRGPDILQRTAPPLSASGGDSLLRQVERPPPNASNNPADQANGTPTEMTPEAQAEARRARQDGSPTPEPAAEPAPAEQKTEAEFELPEGNIPEEVEVQPGKKQKLEPWIIREITKARQSKRDAEIAARQAQEMAEKAVREAAELRAKIPVEKPEVTDPRPARDEHDTDQAYEAALLAWGVREGERQAESKRAETARREAEEAQRKAAEAELVRLNSTWNERKAAAMAKHADYLQVAERQDLQVTLPMAHAIMAADNGPDIAYHLGKNPDIAARISTMSNPAMQALEIGRLSAQLAAPAAPARRPPAPIQPVTGGGGAGDDIPREPSMDEYAARRTKQIQESRKPFFGTAR